MLRRSVLAASDRWLDAKWSPNSRFLAVGNHFDGHIADIYVFGVVGSAGLLLPDITLRAHSPYLSTYDVPWEVIGWHLHQREILLKKAVKFQALTDRVYLRLDEHPLSLSVWPR